jgi:hypothetical protein
MCHDKCLISWFSFKLFLSGYGGFFLVVKLFLLGYGGLLYYSFCFDASRSSAYTFKFYELYEV